MLVYSDVYRVMPKNTADLEFTERCYGRTLKIFDRVQFTISHQSETPVKFLSNRRIENHCSHLSCFDSVFIFSWVPVLLILLVLITLLLVLAIC